MIISQKKKTKNENTNINKSKCSVNKNFTENYILSDTYNISSITLIARDPFNIYAYWDIALDSVENIKNKIGPNFNEQILTLRLYNVTLINFDGTNAISWFDIDINSNERSKYINLWNDNVSYVAEIGIRSFTGSFLSIARSNTVTTQRHSLANNHEVTLMEVKDNKNSNPICLNNPSKIFNEEDNSQDICFQTIANIDKIEANTKKIEENFNKCTYRSPYGDKEPLTAEEIIAYYSRISPLLSRIKNKTTAKINHKENFLVDSINSWLYDSQDIYLQELFLKGSYFRKKCIGASEEYLLDNQTIGASEILIEEKEKDFFFELNTELIVYGKTKPNANVYWGGSKIDLNDDGTFSFRMSLSDGTIPLEFEAHSNDYADNKKIITSAIRTQTLYS